MKQLIIISLLIGSLAYGDDKELKPINKTLHSQYNKYIKYTKMVDKCHESLSTTEAQKLEQCEAYELILSEIKARIRDIETIKAIYYKK